MSFCKWAFIITTRGPTDNYEAQQITIRINWTWNLGGKRIQLTRKRKRNTSKRLTCSIRETVVNVCQGAFKQQTAFTPLDERLDG